MHNAAGSATGAPLSLRRGSRGKSYEDSLFRGSRGGCLAAHTNMQSLSNPGCGESPPVTLELELELQRRTRAGKRAQTPGQAAPGGGTSRGDSFHAAA